MAEKKSKLGRPVKYGEATKMLSIRVPVSRFEHYKKVFKNILHSGEGKNVTQVLQ